MEDKTDSTEIIALPIEREDEGKPVIPPSLELMSKEQLVQVVSGFRDLLSHDVSAKLIVKRGILRNKRTAPYYRERFGREIVPIFETMLKSKNPLEVRFTDYPGLGKHSLYLRIQQGMQFAVERLDSTGKYKDLRDKLNLKQTRRGIIIYYDENKQTALIARETTIESQVDLIIDKINTFISESKHRDIFELTDLNLTEKDVERIKEFVGMNPSLVHNITQSSIKIVKLIESNDEL